MTSDVLKKSLDILQRQGRSTSEQTAPDAPDYWMEEARRYADNADYWREKAEQLEAEVARLRGRLLEIAETSDDENSAHVANEALQDTADA